MWWPSALKTCIAPSVSTLVSSSDNMASVEGAESEPKTLQASLLQRTSPLDLNLRRTVSGPIGPPQMVRSASAEAIALLEDRLLQLEQGMTRLTLQHQETLAAQQLAHEETMARFLRDVQKERQEMQNELRYLQAGHLAESLSSIEVLRGATPKKDSTEPEISTKVDKTVTKIETGQGIRELRTKAEGLEEQVDKERTTTRVSKDQEYCRVKEKPPSFDGMNVPVEDYIEHLERHFRMTKHTEAYYIQNVALRGFSGQAQAWYRYSGPYKTMKQFCQALRSQFELTPMQALAKLKRRQQKWGEDTKIVLLDLETYFDIAMPYLTDELRLEEAIKDNLRAETIDAIYTLNIGTMTEAIRFADKIDRRAAGLLARESIPAERRHQQKKIFEKTRNEEDECAPEATSDDLEHVE